MSFPHVLSGIGVGSGLEGAPGSGIAGVGGVYASSVTREGDLITTKIFVDLTGLSLTAAAGDIIGVAAAANCHLGQITTSQCGTLWAGRMTCMELPAGGDPDIDLYSATEATGTENAAITGLTETQLVDAADAAANAWVSLTALPAANEYLYLVGGAGATVFGVYTGGKLLIELYGKKA